MKHPVAFVWFLVAGLHAFAGDVWFPADAVVDVTKAPYAAKPDDGVDDTDAIQRAITDHVDTGRTLFFPAGVYDVSRPLVSKDREGKWRAHITFQGAGRDRTVLRLADRAAGFGDGKKPAAVLATGSHWQEGDGLDGGRRGLSPAPASAPPRNCARLHRTDASRRAGAHSV